MFEKHNIITISREFGSGGRTVGKMVAEKLGIKCYDEEIINEVAKCSGLAEAFIREHGEYSHEGLFGGARDLDGNSLTDGIWLLQREIILEIAHRENCVIVGRCADAILRNDAHLLTVFIHAPMKARIQRAVDVYGQTEKSTEKKLLQMEKRRKAYYKTYTDIQYGDMNNYALALDSSVLGLETCADVIVTAFEKM